MYMFLYCVWNPTYIVVVVVVIVYNNRGEEGEVSSKKEFIQTARMIAKESEEVVKMARKVASACTDKRMATVSNIIINENNYYNQ